RFFKGAHTSTRLALHGRAGAPLRCRIEAMTEARPFRELLAQRVRRRRREIGLTQDELARQAWSAGSPSMTRGVIAAVERGTADLTLPQLAVLVRVLGTDLETLLGSGGKVFIDEGVAIEVDELVAQVLGRATPWEF